MKLKFLGTLATLDRTGLTIGTASEPEPPKTEVDITEEDIFSGSRALERLQTNERMELLTDALERLVREQTGLEESFYELVERVTAAQADLDRPDGVPETVWNLNTQRLDRDSRRLVALMGYIRETINKIELIRTHLKVVAIDPGQLELQVARKDCLLAVDEFLGRAKSCLQETTRFQTRLETARSDLSR